MSHLSTSISFFIASSINILLLLWILYSTISFIPYKKIGFNPLIIIETKKIKLKNVNEKIDVETLNADNRDVAVVLIYVLTSEFFMR